MVYPKFQPRPLNYVNVLHQKSSYFQRWNEQEMGMAPCWWILQTFQDQAACGEHVIVWSRGCIYKYNPVQLLTSGLAKNSSKKKTICSCPLLLASATRKDRCKYESQFYSCWMRLAVVAYLLFLFSSLNGCLCEFNKCVVHAFTHVSWIP